MDDNVKSEAANEGASDFSVFSTPPLLGEERKDNGNGGDQAASFSFTTEYGIEVEVQTLDDLLNTTPAEREWTVEGILPDSGLAILGDGLNGVRAHL